MIAALVTYISAWIMLILICKWDAVYFPRDDEGGTHAEQVAFHVKLNSVQIASSLAWGLLAWWLSGSLLVGLIWLLGLGVIYFSATQDLGYWIWRIILGLSDYHDWAPFGNRIYNKRWNLWLRLHKGDTEKWLDTTYRVWGFCFAHFFFIAAAALTDPFAPFSIW